MEPKDLDGFEQKLDRLQEIVKELEAGKLSLQNGMDLYKEGIECASECKKLLETAKHQLSVWRNGQDEELELTQLQAQDLPNPKNTKMTDLPY